MNKNKGVINLGLVISIVLLAAIVGGTAYYLGKGSFKEGVKVEENNLPTDQNKKADTTANQISTKSSSSDITCNDSPNYFVVSKSLGSETGTDILIKYKNNNKNITCDYKVEGTDFEIKDNGNSEYFYAINNNLLILDSGTGPGVRGVIIYNLDSRKKVFDDIYSMDGVENLSIKDNTLTYWSPKLNQPITKQNCSLTQNSLNRVIASHILIDLSTLIKKNLGEDKCIYIQ